MIADDVAELQFGAEVVLVAIDAEAQRQRPGQERFLLALVANPHVVAHRPLALVGLEVLDERGLGRVLEQGVERAFAVVVVLAVEVHDGLPFHVRLAGKDEHLEGLRFVRRVHNGMAPRQETDKPSVLLDTHRSVLSCGRLVS